MKAVVTGRNGLRVEIEGRDLRFKILPDPKPKLSLPPGQFSLMDVFRFNDFQIGGRLLRAHLGELEANNLIERIGFQKCGVVGGRPRILYRRTPKGKRRLPINWD